MFYSAATGGFYDPAIHSTLPDDAVIISKARHAELLDARSAGKRVAADGNGRPVIKLIRPNLEQLRASAVTAVKAEAGRRILAVASVERQSNDNALLAEWAILAAAPTEERARISAAYFDARVRRGRIDAIRAASNAIEEIVGRMPASNLTSFDPSSLPHWPETR
jgi:hypothetical protein